MDMLADLSKLGEILTPPEVEGDMECLIVHKSGQVFLQEGYNAPYPVDGPFFAVGSGAEIAIGAMAMGASAEQAVKIAAMYDTQTGGKVTVLSLEDCDKPKGIKKSNIVRLPVGKNEVN